LAAGVPTTLTKRKGAAMSRRERESERWQALGVGPQRKVREADIQSYKEKWRRSPQAPAPCELQAESWQLTFRT
jgi:hypothetical protein